MPYQGQPSVCQPVAGRLLGPTVPRRASSCWAHVGAYVKGGCTVGLGPRNTSCLPVDLAYVIVDLHLVLQAYGA